MAAALAAASDSKGPSCLPVGVNVGVNAGTNVISPSDDSLHGCSSRPSLINQRAFPAVLVGLGEGIVACAWPVVLVGLGEGIAACAWRSVSWVLGCRVPVAVHVRPLLVERSWIRRQRGGSLKSLCACWACAKTRARSVVALVVPRAKTPVENDRTNRLVSVRIRRYSVVSPPGTFLVAGTD